MNAFLTTLVGLTGIGTSNAKDDLKPKKVIPDKDYNNPTATNIYESNVTNKSRKNYNAIKRRQYERSRNPSITGIIPDNYNSLPKDQYGDLKKYKDKFKLDSFSYDDNDNLSVTLKKKENFKVQRTTKQSGQQPQAMEPNMFSKGSTSFEKYESQNRVLSSNRSSPSERTSDSSKKSEKKFEPFQVNSFDRPIGSYSNNSSMMRRSNSTNNGSNSPNKFFDAERNLTNRQALDRAVYDKKLNKGSWEEMFDTPSFDNHGKAAASNGVANLSSMTKKVEMERQLSAKDSWSPFQQGQNMTYNMAPPSQFVHNNMVPQFRSKSSYGNYDKGLNNIKTQKLELFTGVNQPKQLLPKRESGPRFKPQLNVNNVFGTPNLDYELDRYNTMLSDTKNGELAFDPIRVNPGLDLDYYEQGNDGYHPMRRILPKTTNQLRNANKQKTENGNMINHGQKGSKRSLQAPVNKNRPYTFYEQGEEDLYPTEAYNKAPRVRENYQMGATRRDYTNVAYTGGPGTSYGDVGQTGPEFIFPKHKISDKITYGNAGLRNVQRENEAGYVGNYYVHHTQRVDTENADRAGNIYGTPKTYFVDPKDVPRVTTKETTLFDNGLFSRVRGNDKGTVPFKQKMKTTMKEMIENQKYSGVIGQLTSKGRAYDPKDVPKTTTAETTLFDTARFNKISGLVNKNKYFDPKDRTKTTLKELLEVETHTGNFGGDMVQTNTGYQTGKWRAPVTFKQMVENADRAGNVEKVDGKNGGYLSAKYRAPVTFKQMVEDADRAGNVEKVDGKNGGYLSAKYRAPVTLKQMIENTVQIGTIGREGRNKGGYQTEKPFAKPTNKQSTSVFKMGNVNGVNDVMENDGRATKHFAKPTNKQFTSNFHHKGTANATVSSPATYDPYYNMELDDRKEKIVDRYRVPTTSNYDKTPAYDFTAVRLKEMPNIYRVEAGTDTTNNIRVLPGCFTKNPTFMEENVRLDTAINSNLQNNPYNQDILNYFPSMHLSEQPSYTYTGFDTKN